MNTNEKGNIGLTQAIAYFGRSGYTISIPLNDSQPYDLVVEKNGIFQSVQVKYVGTQKDSGSFSCSLRVVSGSSRQVVYSLKDTNVDLLFCYCSNGSMFLIPCEQIVNCNSLNLRETPNKFAKKGALDTSQFLIK